jgi:IS1 family transposase
MYTFINEIQCQQQKKFSNSSILVHNSNTRNKHHLHRPNANLSCVQKSTFYTGIKIFKSLPRSLTSFKNEKVKF